MMKKTNLFVKIYLGFWLTLLVTAGAFFYLERLLVTTPMINQWQSNMDQTVQFYAKESARQYERGGVPLLQKYFTDLERATGIRAYLLDEKGTELTGRIVDKDIEHQISINGGRKIFSYKRMEKYAIAARKIITSKESAFWFAAVFPHPRPPALRADMGPPGGPPPAPASIPPPQTTPSGPPPPHDFFMPPPEPPPHFFPPNFLVWLFVWLGVSGVICYFLARYLTSPIFKLGRAVRQLADGDLSVRVGPSMGGRRDELSALAGDFDQMARRLENLLTSQRNLLRDVSHELRSPLARLNVALELGRQNMEGRDAKHLDRIALETERINDLIGHILTYNKMTTETIDLTKTFFDLSILIKDVAADANYETHKNRVMIQTNEPISFEGNYDYIRRAFENIIRNAVYHTPDESPIEISSFHTMTDDKPLINVIVRDHGRGIPEDALPFIFKPFFKIAGNDSRHSGSGLGLAISESAIRLHHGTISARNAHDGGLMVEILLPVAKPVTP